MKLVDVHCHLNHELFKEDIDTILGRARKSGVKAILISGVNPEANKQVLSFVEKDHSLLKASLGIYPIDALGIQPDGVGLPSHKGPIDLETEFSFLEKNNTKFIAIGEVGMDFHWASKEETYERQAENFRKIIRFAIKLKKPLVIHSRKAEEECVQILSEEIKEQEIPVVNHCFSGGKEVIRKAAALGHYFSIPPNIVKASNFQTLVKMVDIHQLLTETDSPWLSPIKEQKNEPAFVMKSIEKIAEIKQISIEAAASQIWKNYQKVFGTS
ncbi:TatD family hydrolase [Candidatus Woesearchaeota archaeon]|nr:TatD family hydrolase [Candidatus Woesearchaeota archaeon]